MTVLLIALLVCQTASFGQTNNEGLTNQKITVSFEDVTLIYVLNKLAVEHRVPIGLEESSSENFTKKLNIKIEAGTLKDVLDEIVRQDQAYRWELKDGVINFTPVTHRHSFLERLLVTPVNRYAPKEGSGKFTIRDAIYDLPEVKNLLVSNNVGIEKTYYPYYKSIYSNSRVNVGISNTDVRGVLNKVVRDSEHKIWVVEMVGDAKDKLLISF